MNIIIPDNQKITIQPFSNRIFDYNNYESRHYLSRSINTLLESLGTDCVVTGFKIKSIKFINNEVDLIVSPGIMIVDSTLIEYPSDTNLKLNISTYSQQSGFLIVSAGFQYLHNPEKLASRIKLSYITNDGFSQAPDEWCEDFDRLIISKLIFQNDINDKKVVDVTSYFSTNQTVLINGINYIVRHPDNITKQFKEYFYGIYVRSSWH